jgi:hypothetical protein
MAQHEPCTDRLAEFIKLMRARLDVSFHKYGPASENAKLQRAEGKRMLDGIGPRLNKYDSTGNTEWLIDAANFAFLEWCFPAHDDAHFRATESHESPGVPALTVREIEALNKENGFGAGR